MELTLEAGVEELGLHDTLVGEATVLVHRLPELLSQPLLVVWMLSQQVGNKGERGGCGVVACYQEHHALCHYALVRQF